MGRISARCPADQGDFYLMLRSSPTLFSALRTVVHSDLSCDRAVELQVLRKNSFSAPKNCFLFSRKDRAR